MAAAPPPPLPDLTPLAGLPRAVFELAPDGSTSYGDLGVAIGASGAPLRLLARRVDGKIRISQVLGRGANQRVRRTKLKSDSFEQGIERFVRIELFDAEGKRVSRTHEDFCPNAPAFRIDELDPSIRRKPTFPSTCGGALAKAMVWGIDRGWAANFATNVGFGVPVGRYTAQVTLDPGKRLRDRNRSNNRLTLPVRIKPAPPAPPEPPPEPEPVASAAGLPKDIRLPDLRALPAYGVGIDESGRELTFSSTVWNAGPGPIWLEGRRGKSARRMETLQVLPQRSGQPVRRAVNDFVFDLRDGHGHWHYNGLARYRLLRKDGTVVNTAEKQGFCFLPTDPVDLTVPGAVLVPPTDIFGGGFCGRAFSVAVRMRLDAGWGDTYGGGLPGQTLDIEGLEDGTYYIEVLANATGRLFERSKANNVSRRRIILETLEDGRIVKVPPVNGVDTDGYNQGEADTPPG